MILSGNYKGLGKDDDGDDNITNDVHAKYYSLAKHLVLDKVIQR
jgi:hypothetical protein